MKADSLLETLLSQPGLDHERIQAVFDSLDEGARISEFRHALADANVMSYMQVMKIFVNKTLLPKSQTLLKKIEVHRKENVHHKPQTHVQKFHVTEEDRFVTDLAFAGGELKIPVPSPDLSEMKFNHSDEKQAVMLAVEMMELGELTESEIILLETLESFTDSVPAILVLCWVYLCTGHESQAEYWAKSLIASGKPDKFAMEILCLAEQVQAKHLVAVGHYQKLAQLKQTKSIWYLLMAYSQERANCPLEATENYHIYNSIGKDGPLKQFTRQHLQELSQ